jgi:hypothetical protein
MPTITRRVAHARVAPAPEVLLSVFAEAAAPRLLGDIAVRVSTVRVSSLAMQHIIESWDD